MQVDFNPIPATGDMAPAEMPPPGGRSRSEAPLAEGGRSDSGSQAAVDHQKGFRETMDDLLRAEASGKAEGQDLQISEEASGEVSDQDSGEVTGEASGNAKKGVVELPEGTLLEIAAQPAESLQTGSPAGNKGKGSAAAQGEAPSKGDLPQGDPDLERSGDSAKTPSPRFASARSAVILNGDGEAATAEANKAAVAENAPGSASDSLKPEVPLPRQVEAGAHRNGAPAQEGVLKGSVMPAEADVATADKAAVADKAATANQVGRLAEGLTAVQKGAESTADGIRTGMDVSSRPSPTAASVDVKAGPFAEADPSAPRQDGSGSQSLPKAASTPALSATPEEGPSQSFASLVESLEKSGGAGKHLSANADTSLDAVSPSGARGHAASPSAAIDAAKGEPTPTQTLPKEEVVQQIVDSARLRLGSGQSEMRIQLKPEHLGRVRLNIATEQQQVVVKVVADLPMVKELLESNLHQLRTELQGQGLEIHKFDVSVGGDSGSQHKEQQAWGQQPGGRRGNAFTQSDADQQEEGFGSKRQRPQAMASSAEGVDYFA